MSKPIIFVNPETPLDMAVMIMIKEKIKKLPVMEKEKERLKLVGILSLTDIARIQPRLMEEVRALTDLTDMNRSVEEFFYII